MSCAMLLCLLMNHTFTIKLMVMVVPKQWSSDLRCNVIISQESMRLLNLDMSIWYNTISWGGNKSQWFAAIIGLCSTYFSKSLCWTRNQKPPMTTVQWLKKSLFWKCSLR
jgi:hypothetical protein